MNARVRIGLAALAAVLLVVVAAWAVGAGDDGAEVVDVADGSSTTAADRTTTSRSSSTTTTATSSTTTSTTPAAIAPVPDATTPIADSPPATDPPVTAPPEDPGTIDIDAALAFADQHRGAATGPYAEAADPACAYPPPPPSDAGDDVVGDISDWSITYYCHEVFRVALTTADEGLPDSYWVEVDTVPGGCGGVDRLVVGRFERPTDAIVTPTCDPATWQWIDAGTTAIYNGFGVNIMFRPAALGTTGSFRWRAAYRAPTDGPGQVDVVPNSGTATFTPA